MAWNVVDEKTLSLLRKQKEFEDETAKKLSALSELAKDPFLGLFLHRVILDTMKHADTYRLIIELDKRALVNSESKEIMQKELAGHIKEEAKMLKQTKQIVESIKDERAKRMVLEILEDEKKHHHMLTQLLDIIKKESADWNAYFYDITTGPGIP